MNRDNLERLAANPHYKMTAAQLTELQRLRAGDVQHDPTVPKHSTTFDTHTTKPRKQGDEQTL